MRSARNGAAATGPKHRWRAGGMLLQFLPKAPERARQADLHPGDAPEGAVAHTVAEDDAWVEGQSLISTVEDVELIDPDLSGERLLYRLFHERGVRVFPPLPLRAQCSCSRDAVSAMLEELCAEGPRRDGQGWQGGGDLRVLQLGLSIHAGGSRRGVEAVAISQSEFILTGGILALVTTVMRREVSGKPNPMTIPLAFHFDLPVQAAIRCRF